MPLADLQTALGLVVAVQEAPQALSTSHLNLTAEETAWLDSLDNTAGLQVTCAIQRWWRETRLRDLARLTIAALGKDQAARLISDYLAQHICTSLFFLPETLAFLSFIECRTDHPHLVALVQFERALLLAKEEAGRSAPVTERTTTIVQFAAPPQEILAALLQGHPLPEVSATRFPVLVSSLLPHYWRLGE